MFLPAHPSTPRFPFIPAALLAVATVLLYLPGLSGPLVLDDLANLSRAMPARLDWDSLLAALFNAESGPLRRPVANASFLLNFLLLGDATLSFKAVNLGIHLLAGLLLFLLARRLLARGLPDLASRPLSATAFALTLAWLLHPLQVSTVLYTVQRMAELSALFTLAALLSYVEGRERLLEGRAGGVWRLYAAMLLYFPLALLSKENGVSVPLLLLLVEGTLYRLRVAGPVQERALRRFLGLAVALPLLLGGGYLLAHLGHYLAGYAARDFTLGERLLSEPVALWLYLKMILLPNLAEMGFYHDDFPVFSSLLPYPLAALLGHALLLGGAIVLRRRLPLVALGIAWFYACHALESTLLPLELVFEHRNYLALFGPLLAVAGGLLALFRARPKLVRPGCWAVVAALAMLIPLTALRVQGWRDLESLILTAVRYHPGSYRAQLELANLHLRRGEYEQLDRVIATVRGLSVEPATAELMSLFAHCNRPGGSPARYVEVAAEGLRGMTRKGRPEQLLTRLVAQWRQGGCPNLEAAGPLRLIEAALASPLGREVGFWRQRFLTLRARVHAREGHVDAALESYTAAWEADPGSVEPLVERAYQELAWGLTGQAEVTLEQLRRVAASTRRHVGHYLQEVERRIQESMNGGGMGGSE